MIWYIASKVPRGGGYITETQAPEETGHLIEDIKIKPSVKHEYILRLEFKETKKNQDENQGKIFSGKIQINNTQNELTGEIFAHNEVQTEIPDFSLASPDSEGIDHGKGLFVSEDDDGPSFYFRGAVDNNNVRFAEMNWKILRVNGDGSIRLILNAPTGIEIYYNEISRGHKYVGYTFDNEHDCTKDAPCISDYDTKTNTFNKNYGTEENDSNIKKYLEEWYKENLIKYNDEILLSTYCNDTSVFNISDNWTEYGSYERIASKNTVTPSLKCPNPTELDSKSTHDYGGVYKLMIGPPTVDEIILAGIGNDISKASDNNFLYFPNLRAWTISPYSGLPFSGVSVYIYSGKLASNLKVDVLLTGVVPVINLKEDVKFSIQNLELSPGTIDNPYEIQ